MKIVFIGNNILLHKFLPQDNELIANALFISYQELKEKLSLLKSEYDVFIFVFAGKSFPEKKEVLDLVRKIAGNVNKKIIILSEDREEYVNMTLRALQLGAFDFLRFPSTLDLFSKESFQDKFKKMLTILERKFENTEVSKIEQNTTGDVDKISKLNFPPLVLIGISTGGPKILNTLFSYIKEILFPIVVVLHMPESYIDEFLEILKDNFSLPFVKVKRGVVLKENKVFLLAGNKDMELSQRGYFIESKISNEVSYYKPSIDKFFTSAAEAYKNCCIGILMSGLGADGVKGLAEIKKNGGVTIVQDETSSVVFGMPKAALEKKVVDYVFSIKEIGDLFQKINLIVAKKK